LIVLCIVVPVLALIGIGIVVVRGVDPAAAKDRDAAEAALLTNADLGGAFTQIQKGSFARSRGGLRVNGDLAGCRAANNVLEDDGQAFAESTLQSRNGAAVQVVYQQVLALGSPSSATRLSATVTDAVDSCLVAAFEKGGSAAGLSVAIAPDESSAPLGDTANLFHGSMSAQGGLVTGDVDILVVQQGRAVLIVLAVDTTGSLHGTRLETLVETVLVRMTARFGT
jgi:hypothetical protein